MICERINLLSVSADSKTFISSTTPQGMKYPSPPDDLFVIYNVYDETFEQTTDVYVSHTEARVTLHWSPLVSA